MPFSGADDWIEMLLYVAAGAVGAIYTFQVFLPRIREVLFKKPNYDERAAELLEQYRRAQDGDRTGAET